MIGVPYGRPRYLTRTFGQFTDRLAEAGLLGRQSSPQVERSRRPRNEDKIIITGLVLPFTERPHIPILENI